MSINEKIMKALPAIDEKNRNFILGGILLAIFLLDYFVVLQPQLSTLNKLTPQIKILSEDLVRARTNIQRINQYRKQSRELEGKMDFINQGIKSKEEVSVILEKISRVANNCNVHINQMTPFVDEQELLLENNDGKYFSLPISIEAGAGYHDVGVFLNEIESKSASLLIDKFTFAAKVNDRMKHTVRLTLRAIIFEKKK